MILHTKFGAAVVLLGCFEINSAGLLGAASNFCVHDQDESGLRRLAGFAQLVLVVVIQAALVSTTDADEVPDQPAPAVISAPSPTTGAIDKSSPSHAVDLLIELQSKSAGLDFNERARENGNAPRPVITPGAAPQQPMRAPAATTQNAAGLFGSGAVPVARGQGKHGSRALLAQSGSKRCSRPC